MKKANEKALLLGDIKLIFCCQEKCVVSNRI